MAAFFGERSRRFASLELRRDGATCCMGLAKLDHQLEVPKVVLFEASYVENCISRLGCSDFSRHVRTNVNNILELSPPLETVKGQTHIRHQTYEFQFMVAL